MSSKTFYKSMSEINCCGDEEVYGEVFPGWILVRLMNVDETCNTYEINGFKMKEGSFGLTSINDPSFVFDLEPLEDNDYDEDTDISEDERNYYKVMNHYHARTLASAICGFELVSAAIKAGYKPEEGGFACFLMDKMHKAFKSGIQRVHKKVGR